LRRAAPSAYAKITSESPLTFRAAHANVVAGLTLFGVLIGALVAALKPRASLVAENLALRQQHAALRRRTPRPRLRPNRSSLLGRALASMVALD